MSVVRRLVSKAFGRDRGRPGAQNADNLERDVEHEGRLDPNTGALTEGAPPASAGGRVQPSGVSPDPRPARGPSEGEIQNLPG